MDVLVVTLDIDWAPDFVLEAILERLDAKGIRATWFITHDSPGVRRLITRTDRHEFGLHPNFLPGSTQGASEREILAGLKTLLPNAHLMRTHGLVQSTEILRTAANEFDIKIDVSLFLPGQPYLRPHLLNLNHDGTGLVRVPYFWEDDIEASSERPSWSPTDARLSLPGLQVYDFHPIHIYLNTDRMERYHQLKQYGPLSQVTPEQVKCHINRDTAGVGTFFEALIDHISLHQQESSTISEIVDQWRREL
jgi:hypothetical protein